MGVKVGEMYQTLELKDDGFHKGMDGAEGKSGNLMKTLGKAGLAGVVAGVGAAFVGMAKTGLENMRELEEASRDFQVATGASADEVEDFEDTVQDLHKNNTDSYEELGDAVTVMRQKHGDASKGMEQDFLDYAKVTGQDTAEAVEELHRVQKAYGEDLEDMPEIMDRLKLIQEETGISSSELQGALADIAPAAQAAGEDIEWASGMIAVMAENGVSADSASRGLRQALTALEDPTQAEAEAMHTLGMEVRETEEGFEVIDGSIEDVLYAMEDATEGTDTYDAALEILGKRAGEDMITAFQDGEVGIEEMMATLEDSEGSVERASDAYDQELGERWELIKRKYLHPFMETLGETLMGILESLLDFAEEWGPKVAAVFETLTDLVGMLFGEDGETDSFLGELMESFSGIFGSIRKLIETFIDVIQVAWDLFGDDIIKIATFAFEQIQTVITTVLDVIEGIIDMWIAVFTGDWEGFKDALIGIWESLWHGIRDLIMNAYDTFFKDPINNLIDDVVGLFGRFNPVPPFKKAFGNVTSYITDDLPGMLKDGARNILDSFIEGILDKLRDLGWAGRQAAGVVEDLLMGDSPPKKGPLSKIDEGGEKLIEAWADGMLSATPYVIDTATQLGDELVAVNEDTEDEVTDTQEKAQQEREKNTEQHLDKTKSLWERTFGDLTNFIEDTTIRIASDLAEMFEHNRKVEEDYKNDRQKIQDEIKEQIDELMERRDEELKAAEGNQEEMAEIDKKYEDSKRELLEEEKKLLDAREKEYEDQRKSLLDVFKAMLGDFIEMLIKQVLAQQAAAMAQALAASWIDWTAVARAAAAIAASTAALAGLRAIGMEEGGLVSGPIFAQIGEGRDDEAVLPLNNQVLSQIGRGVAQAGEFTVPTDRIAGVRGKPSSLGHRTANITVELDGRTIAKAVEQPLVNDIRVKGGLKV